MTIYVWTSFSKKKNSTKQPTGGTSINVKLKEKTSVEAPVFICTDVDDVNYIQWGSNYYFVEDIVHVTSELSEIHCSMDALATNKSAIVGSSQFVSYYTHNNTEICDKRLSTKTTQTTLRNNGMFSQLGSIDPSTSAYMVTVIGEEAVGVYAMAYDDVLNLVSGEWYENVEDAVNGLNPVVGGTTVEVLKDAIRFVCDAIKSTLGAIFTTGKQTDYIKNCYVLPVTKGMCGGSTSNIKLGRFETGVYGNLVSNRIFSDSCTVAIPWQSTDWRRNSPYTTLYLYIPFIGLTTLPASELIGETSITIKASLDLFSGDCIFRVMTGTKEIAQYTTNLAVPFAIGSSNIDVNRSTMQITEGALSLAYGNVVGSAGEFLGLVNNISGFPQSVGGNSGGAQLGLDNSVCSVISVFHDTTVAPSSVSAIKGTPYNGVMAIPSSGYVQTVGANVDCVAYGSEKNTINSMLDSGIYIE